MKSMLFIFLGTSLGLILSACVNYYVDPSVEKNVRLELLHPTPHSFQAAWMEKMAAAESINRREEPELEISMEPHVARWRSSIDHLKNRTELEQAELTNEIVNREVTYVSDYKHWERLDMWGDPYATLVEGGDCEDIAILKMESLKHLGWSKSQFAILVGYSTFSNPPQSHAVLMVTLSNGAQLVLDSLEDNVEPPKEDHHFNPIYAVTQDHLYMTAVSGG
jgi:predicted transglutaminase-like cysteine proteinase